MLQGISWNLDFCHFCSAAFQVTSWSNVVTEAPGNISEFQFRAVRKDRGYPCQISGLSLRDPPELLHNTYYGIGQIWPCGFYVKAAVKAGKCNATDDRVPTENQGFTVLLRSGRIQLYLVSQTRFLLWLWSQIKLGENQIKFSGEVQCIPSRGYLIRSHPLWFVIRSPERLQFMNWGTTVMSYVVESSWCQMQIPCQGVWASCSRHKEGRGEGCQQVVCAKWICTVCVWRSSSTWHMRGWCIQGAQSEVVAVSQLRR